MKQYAGLNMQELIPLDRFYKNSWLKFFGYKLSQVPSFKALELR